MTTSASPVPRLTARQRIVAIGLALLVLAVFVGANIHLVMVSFASHPDCVVETEGAALRAAKASC